MRCFFQFVVLLCSDWGNAAPPTKPTAVNADICVRASLEIICCASPLGPATHLLTPPPDPSRVHHYGFCSAAPSCATMDLSEAGDAGSGCKDENCSSAFSSPVSHSDHLCKDHEPLFGFIELGGFRKYDFKFFCLVGFFFLYFSQ